MTQRCRSRASRAGNGTIPRRPGRGIWSSLPIAAALTSRRPRSVSTTAMPREISQNSPARYELFAYWKRWPNDPHPLMCGPHLLLWKCGAAMVQTPVGTMRPVPSRFATSCRLTSPNFISPMSKRLRRRRLSIKNRNEDEHDSAMKAMVVVIAFEQGTERQLLQEDETNRCAMTSVRFGLKMTQTCRRPSPSVQSLRLFVRVDHVAGLVVGGRQHRLCVHGAELLDVVGLDVVELNLQHPRLRPFAVLAELDVAKHGLERAGTDVVGELLVLNAFSRRDRLLQHLELRITPRRHVVAQRVDAFGRCSRLISLDQILDTGELHLRYRQPPVVIDEAVEHRTELHLERGGLQAHHTTSDHLRLEAYLVDGLHHSDRIRRIGADHHEVRIGGRDGAHDRGEIGGRGRISLVVDDLEAGPPWHCRVRRRKHCGGISGWPPRARPC